MKSGELSWDRFQTIKKNGQPFFKFTVVTGSMEPVISVGEIVIVEMNEKIEWGDIVVFWQNDKLICHIFWHQNRILTDGDNPILVTRSLNSVAWDMSIRREQILGKVINHRVPSWRLWLMKLQEWRRFRSR